MGPTSVTWRNLVLGTGESADYRILSITGWEGLPAARYEKQPRARAHGAHSTQVWSDERIVTVEGFSSVRERRDEVLAALMAELTYGAGEEALTVTHAGRTLTAQAQLLRADPVTERMLWGGPGRFGWVAQWRCPDPLRYGPAGAAVSSGLPTSGGGLVYPLAYPLDYGTPGDTGQITVVNDGTAPAPIAFRVTGSLPLGFEISADTGERLVYVETVPAGQTLWGDTGTGTLLAEGTSERRGNLTVADWMQVPPKSSITLQFTSLGGAYDPAATLTVPEPRGAFW